MNPHRPSAVAVVAILFAAACGNDSTPPGSPSPLPSGFPTGRGSLAIFSDGDACTARTPGWGPDGPRVSLTVSVSADGSGWVARADATRYGDAEMRFTFTDVTSIGARVTGTMRGTAIDQTSVLSSANPNRVNVSGASSGSGAELIGGYSSQTPLIIGGVTGKLVYTDTQQGIMTCTRANVLLAVFGRS